MVYLLEVEHILVHRSKRTFNNVEIMVSDMTRLKILQICQDLYPLVQFNFGAVSKCYKELVQAVFSLVT